jgi:hypothetical protein
MVANITNFLSNFSNEAARPCNFDVLITSKAIDIPQSMIFKCEASELPSRTFSLVEQKTYGPVQYFPVQNFYEKVNLTFLCSDDMIEKKIFDEWMDQISTSGVAALFGSNINAVQFDFNYKDTYQGQVYIRQYDLTGKLSYKSTLFEAFPISVHPLKLDWGAANEVHKLMVTFAYRYAYGTFD